MHIRFATMHNFGPHAHFETKFKQGLVMICGRNGAGKTHLVNGIYAALTNDFSRFDGVKTDRIYSGAGDKEESFFEIDAEHNGTKFTLRRSLRPNKSSLRITGEKEITKATEIEARLRSDLGVDMKLIDTYVFVDQTKITNFLSHTPAQRAEAFKYLCRTEKADVIYSACSELLTDSELSADIVDNSDELVTDIGRLETAIENYKSERNSYSEKLLNEKSEETAKKIVRRRERFLEVEKDLEEERTKLVERQARLSKRKSSLTSKRKLLKRLEIETYELKSQADAANVALSVWSTYSKRRKRKAELTETKAKLEREGEEKKKPKKPSWYAEKETIETKKNTLHSLLADAEETLENLHQGEVKATHVEQCKCPTCKQSVSLDFIKQQAKAKETLPEQIKQLGDQLKAIKDYDTAYNSWKTWESGWKAKVTANNEELNEFAELKEPSGDKEALTKAVNAYTAKQEELESSQEDVQSLETKVTQAETRVNETEAHITKLTERLSSLVVEDSKLAKARQRLTEHDQARLAVAGVEGKLKEARDTLKSQKDTLDRLKAVIARRGKLQKAMRTLTRVREAFHWNNLPRMVAQGNLYNMEQDINDSLAMFGNPFWAEADENLGFKVHFPGNNTHRAEGLSGGQKGIFAVSFRFAISALFGADIGMTWLDEPTAGMDSDNIVYFREALGTLAQRVRNKRQVVVVTHANELRPAFDQVIEVN